MSVYFGPPRPTGKCKDCGADVYSKTVPHPFIVGQTKDIENCSNCGEKTSKQVNHYLYPQ